MTGNCKHLEKELEDLYNEIGYCEESIVQAEQKLSELWEEVVSVECKLNEEG